MNLVCRWADEEDCVSTDTLQRIHCLHNLAEVLQLAPAGSVPPTLRDDRLKDEAEALRKQYVAKSQTAVDAAQAPLSATKAKISDLITELDSNTSANSEVWWLAALESATGSSTADKLIEELKDKWAADALTNSSNIARQASCDLIIDILDIYLDFI